MNFLTSIANLLVGLVVTGLSVVGVQTPITPPTVALTAAPVAIATDAISVIEWSSEGATECVSNDFNTGLAVSGKVTVFPTQTTTYSVTCSKTQSTTPEDTAGVWSLSVAEASDTWCVNRPNTFATFSAENRCPSDNPAGQSCSFISSLCSVNVPSKATSDIPKNAWQDHCQNLTRVYECISPSGTIRGLASPGMSTVYSGGFDNLVSKDYYFRKFIQNDVDNNGGPFVMDGFYDDKATADRLCSIAFPGSVNGTYNGDKYTSPKNNTLLRWNGSQWVQQSANSHNRHLRYGFTCVTPVAQPPAPTPIWETKSVTKSITVIVVNPETPDIPGVLPGVTPVGTPGVTPGVIPGGVGDQCSDGIDNNGDGLIDSADPRCTGVGDFIEDPIPDAALSLSSASNLILSGNTASLTWSASNVSSCTLSGTNGDSWALSGGSGTIVSSALTSETTFTLSCTDLKNKTVSTSVTVRIAPAFQEI